MAHTKSPAFALIVGPNVAATYPIMGTMLGTTTAALSSFLSTRMILESMCCLIAPAGTGNILITDHAASATNTITIAVATTNLAGQTIDFGVDGIDLGSGLKVNTAASTGTWMYSFRPF